VGGGGVGVGVGGVGWDRSSQGPLSRCPAAIRAKEAQRMKGRGRREVRRQQREEGRSGVRWGGGGRGGGGGMGPQIPGSSLRCPAAIRAKEAQRMKGRGRREVRRQQERRRLLQCGAAAEVTAMREKGETWETI
jgi:hypothetical protein